MQDTLMFVDDGFFGLVKKHLQRQSKKNKKYLQTFRNICRNENLNLKHLFIYTAPPYQGSKPSDSEIILARRYQNMVRMLKKTLKTNFRRNLKHTLSQNQFILCLL